MRPDKLLLQTVLVHRLGVVPSGKQQARAMSIAHRSFGHEAIEGAACTRRSDSATTFMHLPTLELEQALDGIFVFPQQLGNGMVADIGQNGDSPLDSATRCSLTLGLALVDWQ